MERQTNAQVALLAAVAALPTMEDVYVTESRTKRLADGYLKWLNAADQKEN